jgi:hypothetical protein
MKTKECHEICMHAIDKGNEYKMVFGAKARAS